MQLDLLEHVPGLGPLLHVASVRGLLAGVLLPGLALRLLVLALPYLLDPLVRYDAAGESYDRML